VLRAIFFSGESPGLNGEIMPEGAGRGLELARRWAEIMEGAKGPRSAVFSFRSWRERIAGTVEHLYTLRLGGTRDAIGVVSIGAVVLASAPLLAPAVQSVEWILALYATATVGSAVVFWRLVEPWRKSHLLASTLRLRSAESPYRPQQGRQQDGLLLGYTCDRGAPVFVDYEHLTRHLNFTGQSGVGKTVAASTLMFQHIQGGGGLLFIDGKLDVDNLQQLCNFAKWCGREHEVFVINPDDPDNSNSYNPVLIGDPDEKADGILNLIPSTENSPGSDHYKQEAKQSLTTLIAALQRARMAYNMIDLTVLLMSGRALEQLERTLTQNFPNAEETRNFSLFLDKYRAPLSDKNQPGAIQVDKLKGTFGGIGGRLFTFGTGSFGKVMNTYTPDVNLFDAIRGNKIVYVALPTMHKDMSARNFGRLCIADLRTAIGKIQKLPKSARPSPPFWVFCDEAGAYVTDSFSRCLEQSRSANVFFALATQTNANFKAISDELYEMVIGNSWTKVVFKVGTQATAIEAADLIGMKMGVLKSRTTAETKGVSSAFLSPSPEHGTSNAASTNSAERQQEAYIVTPDELKRLSKGECVVTVGGKDIFNLRVSMLSFTPEAKARLGTVRINRFRTEGIRIDGQIWKGADFFRNVDRYLTKTMMNEAAARPASTDPRAAGHRDPPRPADRGREIPSMAADGDADA
jgi:hypothetical protein